MGREKLKHEWAVRQREMTMNRIGSHLSGTQPDRSGPEKVADLDAIDMNPLVSWLPDVPRPKRIPGCTGIRQFA
jgi:hypothetical protein